MEMKRELVNGLWRCVCLAGLVWLGGLSVLTAAKGDAEGMPVGVVEKLASDQFETRDRAYGELSQWAKSHLKTSPELLYRTWKSSGQPEVQTRCYALMKESVMSREFGRGKGFVGILMDVKPAGPGGVKQQRGILIVQVLPKTPGQKSGLKAGDLILGIDQLDFNKLPENQQKFDVRTLFQEYVKSKHPDDVITLHLMRGGKKIDKKVTLGD